jgi:DNA repair protein RadC
VHKENNNKAVAREDATPARQLPDQPEQREPAEFDCVEWNTSTQALAEFLSAIGVADPGRIARSLIEEFGSLSHFLSASWWRLSRVVGRRLSRTIQSSHQLMRAMLEEQIPEGRVVTGSKEFVEFLQVEMGFLEHEQLLAIFVDRGSRLMRIERLANGSFREAPVDKRKIIGCALNIGAAAFFLIHNHPSGIPSPSMQDIRMTEDLRRLAESFDINLLDHLVVARGKIFSIEDCWREARMMQPPGSVADDVAFRTAHPADTPFILADSAARSEFNRLTERLIDRNRGRRHRR